MTKKDVHPQRFVWVKDKAGNEYVCRVDRVFMTLFFLISIRSVGWNLRDM